MNWVYPLDAIALPEDSGDAVTLTELREFSCWQRDWLGAARDSLPADSSLPAVGQASLTSSGQLRVNIARGRWWLLTPDSAAADVPPASQEGYHDTDLSHARCLFALSGPASAELLNRGLAIDLDPSRFAAGQVVSSHMNGIDVTLIRLPQGQGDIWLLLVARGFCLDLWHFLSESAHFFGVQYRSAIPLADVISA